MYIKYMTEQSEHATTLEDKISSLGPLAQLVRAYGSTLYKNSQVDSSSLSGPTIFLSHRLTQHIQFSSSSRILFSRAEPSGFSPLI